MSFDKPDCFFREEQVWNSVYDHGKQIIRTQTRNKCIPKIERIQVSDKDSEESFVFPKNITAFSIRDSGNSRMRYSYETGEVENVSGNFLEFGPYAIYKESELNRKDFDDLTLYFSSSKDNRIIEVIYWT